MNAIATDSLRPFLFLLIFVEFLLRLKKEGFAKWKANLQTVRIVDENGDVKRVKVSARALRSGKVTRA
mgnify:CR=1 FL=1